MLTFFKKNKTTNLLLLYYFINQTETYSNCRWDLNSHFKALYSLRGAQSGSSTGSEMKHSTSVKRWHRLMYLATILLRGRLEVLENSQGATKAYSGILIFSVSFMEGGCNVGKKTNKCHRYLDMKLLNLEFNHKIRMLSRQEDFLVFIFVNAAVVNDSLRAKSLLVMV